VRAFSAAPASTEEAPSVFDKLISLTVVDPGGARRKIPGLVGKLNDELDVSSRMDVWGSLFHLKTQEPHSMMLVRRTKLSSGL
jgi:hypothetical protein